ncbi:MAG TPA: metalloregulator ArsR/SmtB family transcription factor [Candidatus Dormibacteraeota bacterium]|nr:metalloregulator ArsR/SmtB family transcription factor [Candidatus Dormibacteraeota bacterium]
MPPVDDASTLGRPVIAPSAPMELVWIGHQLLNPTGHDGPVRVADLDPPRAAQLALRLQSFWGDGFSGGVGELVIMADQAGRLFSPDLEGLLGDLPLPAGDPSDLQLRSESPGDRQRMVERLGRLQRESSLRQQYAALLGEIWEPVRPEWEATGLPRMRNACDRVTQRLDRGTAIEEAVPVLVELRRKKPRWGPLLDEGLDQGRLAVIPGYFGGSWSLWDFPQHLVVGFNGSTDPLEELGEVGRTLAPRLKALGDRTRLHVLLYLADHPTSVGELAQLFHLAQPTVSAHLRTLREASLVVGQRSEGRTVYRADRVQLAELLREVATGASVEL